MRAVLILSAFFVAAALCWALQGPLTSFSTIKNFASQDCDVQASCDALQKEGPGATLALRHGLTSSDPMIRLRSARVLALNGDKAGDEYLLETIRDHSVNPNDAFAAVAEQYLQTAWEERDGPPADLRQRILRAPLNDPEQPALLNQALEKFPNWSAGYVCRARNFLRAADGPEARRYAIVALMLEPNNYEAMVLLAQSLLLLEAPEQAYLCMRQAVNVNPRLKHAMHDDIQEILKAIDQVRARRRREKRRESPLV